MNDQFITERICDHFGISIPEDTDSFVTSEEQCTFCMQELLHMGYTLEIGHIPPYTYSAVAKKWESYDSECDMDNFEYAFATDEYLSRAVMQLLIKVLGP